MEKKKPMSEDAWTAAMERIALVTGTRTQVQLANALDVRQSSISDAKRRRSIPSDWLLTLLRKHQAHPEWLLTGEGPATLGEVLPDRLTQLSRTVNETLFALSEMQLRFDNALLMATMSPEDLAAHKQRAAAQLDEGLRGVVGMTQNLQAARQAAGMGA